MKSLTFLLLTIGLCLNGQTQTSDALKLICPLNESIQPSPEKKSTDIGAADLKAVFISKNDTTVKACADGMITVILHDEDGKWELMFTHDDNTFWYSGVSRLVVTKGQKIKAGETIGYTKKGEKIILQMMDAETSVDPKQYLSCEL